MAYDPRKSKRPQSPEERAKTESITAKKRILRQISRARTRLLVCFLTLPVYVVAVWILLNNQQSTDGFMFAYMGVWAAFGVDMARRRCPNCGEQFFVKIILLNLLTRRCVHCRLDMDADDGDGDHQRVDF